MELYADQSPFQILPNNGLDFNLNRKNHIQNKDWVLTFGIFMDNIWRARNDTVFTDNSISYRAILCRAQRQVEASIHGSLLIQYLDPMARSKDRIILPCSWVPPPAGFISVCVDAAVSDGGNKAGCGGVIRDHMGNFIFGYYSMKLNPSSVLEAEALAILHGCIVVIRKGYHQFVVESS